MTGVHETHLADSEEIARTVWPYRATRLIAVRDSKDPNGPKLFFTPAEWDAFLDGVKANESDVG